MWHPQISMSQPFTYHKCYLVCFGRETFYILLFSDQIVRIVYSFKCNLEKFLIRDKQRSFTSKQCKHKIVGWQQWRSTVAVLHYTTVDIDKKWKRLEYLSLFYLALILFLITMSKSILIKMLIHTYSTGCCVSEVNSINSWAHLHRSSKVANWQHWVQTGNGCKKKTIDTFKKTLLLHAHFQQLVWLLCLQPS